MSQVRSQLRGPRRPPLWLLITAAVIAVLGTATVVWWGDIVRTTLDPKVPFQTYRPPPAPDYSQTASWAARPERPIHGVDVFVVTPSAFTGGAHWNAPIDDRRMRARLNRLVLPNVAGPFAPYANIYAPHYRHASFYTQLTTREDGREARGLAYRDVRAAFRHYLRHHNGGRPFILIGQEQGGLHIQRLLAEDLRNTTLHHRLVAAYVLDSPLPVADFQTRLAHLKPCRTTLDIGCVAAWTVAHSADDAERRQRRTLIWDGRGHLQRLDGQATLCVNPISWRMDEAPAPARLHRGGVNATGLEPSVTPPALTQQIGAQCRNGLLWVDTPAAPSLRPSGSWLERHMSGAYNLFYADIAADGARRLANWRDTVGGQAAPPITVHIFVRHSPIHKVD